MLCAGAFRIIEAGSWGAPHPALKVLCVQRTFPVGPQFYTCVFISWCTIVPVGNVSAKGQAAALHGGPVYFMRGTARGQELAPRTVTSMAHRTDHRYALGRERALRNEQACLVSGGVGPFWAKQALTSASQCSLRDS